MNKAEGLGGPASNALHMKAITIPEMKGTPDWRATQRDDYNRQMKKNLTSDMSSNSRDASFYAFAIESGVEASVFSG